jgi:hypothetical protein
VRVCVCAMRPLSMVELVLDQPLCAQPVEFQDEFLFKNKLLAIDETSLRIFRDIRNGVTVSAEDRRALGFHGSVLEVYELRWLVDWTALSWIGCCDI